MQIEEPLYMSEKETANFRSRLTLDDKNSFKNSILFGKAYGKPIGIHTDEHRTHPVNANQLVIGSHRSGKTYNFLTSNLLNGAYSAIVTNACEDFRCYYPDFKAKGIKVHTINLNDLSNCSRYNPFLHMEKNESSAVILAALLDRLFCPQKDGNPYWNRVETALSEMAVMHVLLGKIDDKQRNFRSVVETLQRMVDIVKEIESPRLIGKISALLDFDPTEDKKRFKTIESAPTKTLKAILMSWIVDMQIFITNYGKIFEEEEGTDNIPIEDFCHNQHYLFLCGCNASDYLFGILNLLVAVLDDRLYSYAETSLKMEIPQHIQFFLDDFKRFDIPYILVRNTTCRKYNKNWTVLIETPQDLKEKYPNEEWLSVVGCDSAVIFLDTAALSDFDFVQTILSENGAYNENYRDRNLLFSDNIKQILSEMSEKRNESGNDWVVCLQDYPPLLCDKLNPKDFKK